MFDLMNYLNSKLEGLDLEVQRLFHGRGKTFAGLEFMNLDWFSPVMMMTLYQEPDQEWFQCFSAKLIEKIQKNMAVSALVVQRRYLQKSPMETLWGEKPEKTCVRENGLNYWVRFQQRQNIGFFPDIKGGRDWVQQNAKGKNVLNLFAYTCSFSVAAIAGGANSVVNIDMNRHSLNLGRQNHLANQQSTRKVRFFAHDIFKSWGKIKRFGPYDLMIIDPPWYQKGSFHAEKDYLKIIRRIPDLLAQQGQIMATVNAPERGFEVLPTLFAETCPQYRVTAQLSAGSDFPEKDPEQGLKVYLLKA